MESALGERGESMSHGGVPTEEGRNILSGSRVTPNFTVEARHASRTHPARRLDVENFPDGDPGDRRIVAAGLTIEKEHEEL